MTEKDNDSLDIEALYKQASTETASKQTDEAILYFARSQLEQRKSQSSIATKNKISWIKWQWPVSIAASVMFVAVLFIHYDQYSSPAYYANNQPSDSQPAEIQVESMDSLEVASAVEYRKRTASKDSQELATQRLNAHAVLPSQEEVIAQSSSEFDEAYVDNLPTSKGSLAVESLDLKDSSEEVAVTMSASPLEQTAVAEFSSTRQFGARLSSSGIASIKADELDTAYLDSLIAVIERSKERIAETSDNLGEAAVQQAKRSKIDAEITIREYLESWQKLNPDKSVPEKYQCYIE